MPATDNYRNRKQQRLKGYDYSKVGFIITICVENMECLFGELKMQINDKKMGKANISNTSENGVKAFILALKYSAEGFVLCIKSIAVKYKLLQNFQLANKGEWEVD